MIPSNWTSWLQVSVLGAYIGPLAEQISFATSSHPTNNLVTPQVSAYVKDVLAETHIPGLALGLVRLSGDRQPTIELAAWGKQSEDAVQDDLTPDVSYAT